MTKKAIIFVLLLFFLNLLVIPNYVSAMGSSGHVSDQAGWLMVGGLVVLLGILYIYSRSETIESKKNKKKTRLSPKRLDEGFTRSGELVFLSW